MSEHEYIPACFATPLPLHHPVNLIIFRPALIAQ